MPEHADSFKPRFIQQFPGGKIEMVFPAEEKP
jgi:hypothetical protein